MSKNKKIVVSDVGDLGLSVNLLDGKHTIIPLMPNELEQEYTMDIPDEIPILTLRSSVLFPGAITPISVGRDKSIKLIRDIEKIENAVLGAVLQRDSDVDDPQPSDMHTVGTLAQIVKVLEMPNGNLTVLLSGVEKISVTKYTSVEPYLKANVVAIKDDAIDENTPSEFSAMIDSIRDVAVSIIKSSNMLPKEAIFALKNIDSDSGVINFISINFDFTDANRQMLLETPSIKVRAEKLLEILVHEQQRLELINDIQDKVKMEIDQQQRDYFLQQHLRTIQDELGDGTDAEINALRERAEQKKWSAEVGKHFDNEVAKLERLNPSVAEYSVMLNYLQLMLDLPWNEFTKDNLNLKDARKQLDSDHYGLDEVKERILEHLAVLKLRGDLKSPIICLYGAPGVGKTSLGKSVAASIGRKFGRIALGGLHDESEIRGHRRTYIGAMPGRIIQTIKRCESSNPVIILDEIDKVTKSNHGDPSSALLEVLDPEQNTSFHDNYLDIDFDLSKVLFIATANNVQNINPALRDRMEMINIAGYLVEEKIEIAKRHLIPKQCEMHGVPNDQLSISRKVIEQVISDYTREAGVRKLDKSIAKITRSRAKDIAFENSYNPKISMSDLGKILGVPHYRTDVYDIAGMVGVVTGLAWTEVGGDILYIESVLTPGKGVLTLTGNLGNVMKESATIAFEWVKANHEMLGIERAVFENNDINIHVPDGAIPKDGPSAGITMITSIVSTLTGRKITDRVAMTGETTLRGRVTPVGGVKEKILAAKRAGITSIILSEDNRKDIEEIKSNYTDGLAFHYVRNNIDVLNIALQS